MQYRSNPPKTSGQITAAGDPKLPEGTVAYFDAATIAARGLARNGNLIPRWPGQANGRCQDRLISRGGNVFQTGALSSVDGPSVYVSDVGQLETPGCRFWERGENHIVLVAGVPKGRECVLASETTGYDTPGGYIIEVMGGRVCVSQRVGEPFLESATQVTSDPQALEARLVHVWAGAGGRWELRVDGAIEDAANGAALTPEPGAHFQAGQIPGHIESGFQMGMILSVAGALPAGELRAVEDEAAARWGVSLRRPDRLPADVREALAPCVTEAGVLDARCAVDVIRRRRQNGDDDGGGGGGDGNEEGPPARWPTSWPPARWSARRGGGVSYWPVVIAGGLALLVNAVDG
jgi:hypothetical protein